MPYGTTNSPGPNDEHMTVQEISFHEVFPRLIRRWWLIALLIVLGGCLGWFIHLARPPLYETAATFSVVVNFSETYPLDEREQDQAVGVFKALLTSTPVVEKVQAEAQARGIPPEALVLNRRVFTERRQSQIDLIVRHEDPQIAAEIANLWAEQAYEIIVEAYSHALKAQSLGQYQAGLAHCLQIENPPPESLCAAESLDALEQRIQEVDAERQAELLSSQALLPILVFEFSQYAPVPSESVAYRAIILLLAGTLIGFVCGIVLALLPSFKKITRNS